MDIVHPAVERYMKDLFVVDDSPVLLEMEKLAESKGFPIIGRLCGRALEVMARAVGARRIFELGSGFGYSSYWFSRATGPSGEIHLTDMDPDNEQMAMDFLGRADLADPIHFHVGDALEKLEAVEGDFDVVYCDIDKGDYPRAWEIGRQRVRVGGLYVCDNMLWSGRVTGEASDPDVTAGWTEAIAKTNRMIAQDGDFREFILPTRDGVVFALRVS